MPSRTDWRLAAHHFAAAGDIDELHRLVEASVPSIMAGGDFAIAESFIDRLPDGRTWPIFDMVLSRMELRRDRLREAVRLAEAAVSAQRSADPGALLDQALANLQSVYYQAGMIEAAIAVGEELRSTGRSKPLVEIGWALILLMDASVDGTLGAPLALLHQMADRQRSSGDLHYLGITQINIAEVERALGHWMKLACGRGCDSRTRRELAGHEAGAAHLLLAWCLAHSNDMPGAIARNRSGLASEFRLRSWTRLDLRPCRSSGVRRSR